MIVIEFYRTRRDGVKLYKTYSSEGKMIERDGDLYEEAIDPEDTDRVYTETDIDIQREEEPDEPSDGPEEE